MKKIIASVLFLSCVTDLSAVTLVYSMKIRRSFEAHKFLPTTQDTFFLLTALPIFYARSRHLTPAPQIAINEKTRVVGSVFNARYVTASHWWAEVTTALENQTSCYTGSETFKASKTDLDDIVVSVGKNFFFNDSHGQIAAYGIAGFPTKNKITLAERYDGLVGTPFFTIGAGGECSYSFIKELKRSLTGIMQLRFLHSFNRCYFPVLPRNARIQPGNVTDFFVIMQYRQKKNIVEVGYNPTFFTNQAILLPDEIRRNQNVVRHSFYFNMSHLFKESLLLKKPGVVSTGFNISRADFADTKIAVWWVGLTLLF